MAAQIYFFVQYLELLFWAIPGAKSIVIGGRTLGAYSKHEC